VVGCFVWAMPDWAGGGDNLTQNALNGNPVIGVFCLVAFLRFFLGPLSYAAGTPGGLFAPIIALGALLGAVVGQGLHGVLPGLVPSPTAFAVAGMAALFTATVRAPLTGIVICLEMAGCFPLFLHLLAACLGAHLASSLLRDRPIYDALADPEHIHR